MNPSMWHAVGGADVGCSAWLGGMALLLVWLGVWVAVQGDVHLAKPPGLERCKSGLLLILRRLAGRILRGTAGLLRRRRRDWWVYPVSLLGEFVCFFIIVIHGICVGGVVPPNDPKLSDCGGRRSPCGKAAGAKVVGAWAVTPGAVRCSAWLGVAAIWSSGQKWERMERKVSGESEPCSGNDAE